MKIALTKRGRDLAVWARAERDAEPGERYLAMITRVTRVPIYAVAIGAILFVGIVVNATSSAPGVGFFALVAVIALVALAIPYRALVVTDRRLIAYRAMPFTSDPGRLLWSVPRLDVIVRGTHTGYFRPFVLDVNGRRMKFYTYSMSYWQDALAVCQALGSNAEQSAA
jgi:hypothetical protein